MTHRMTSATLTADGDQAGNHNCADRAPDDPARGRIARRKLAGKQRPPDQPINARVHRQNLAFARKEAAVLVKHGRSPNRSLHVSQVVFSQLAAAVDSLCDVPGFGQLGGAVMSRMGIVMIDCGSQTGNSYLGSFLVIPMIVSL